MFNQFITLGIFLSIASFSSAISAQNLSQILNTVRKNSLNYQKDRAQIRSAKADIVSLEKPYDWSLKGTLQNAHDKTMQNNSFSGEDRKQREWSLSLHKMISLGTHFEFSYINQWQESGFRAATPAQQLPDGTVIPGQDPSSATIFNPAFINTYSLTIQQPLYKNFNSSTIDAKKGILKLAAELPRYQSLIQLQADQFQAEQLYWNIIALNKKIAVMKRLIAASKDFTRRMKERVQIGRAENVDLADAEARVLNNESNLVDMQITNQDLRVKLISLMYEVPPTTVPQFNKGQIDTPQLKIKHLSSTLALGHAQKSRLDLRLNKIQQSIEKAEIRSAIEEGKWELNLFARIGANGIDSSASDSLKTSTEAKRSLNVIGLNFDVPLGGDSQSRSQMVSHYHKKAALELSQRQRLNAIQKDLHIAYIKKSGGLKKESVIRKQIASLNRKRKAEFRKLKQARSERVAVIRYDMEVLMAELELVESQSRQRLAESEIRYLLHDYPARKP